MDSLPRIKSTKNAPEPSARSRRPPHASRNFIRQSNTGRRAGGLALRRLDYINWQKENPSKSFKDYFTYSVSSRLANGKSHPTLGGKLCYNEYETAATTVLRRLLKFGLKLEGTCVDYGCGTLRVGSHLIGRLGQGCYWGLDINGDLLTEGRRLIGEKLWHDKLPNLRIISPDTIAEAAGSRPSNLISVAVLFHVHPDELSEYIENILNIVRPSRGQAFLTGHWIDDATLQHSPLSWAHSLSNISELVRIRGGELTVLKKGEYVLKSLGRIANRGLLKIASTVTAFLQIPMLADVTVLW